MGLDNIRTLLQDQQPVIKVQPVNQADFPSIDSVVADLLKTKKKIIFTMGKGGIGKTAWLPSN